MQTTPGNGPSSDVREYPDLPGVIEEKDQLISAARQYVSARQLDRPSAEGVIEILSNCCIAHFACHGYTNHLDPSDSGLIFQIREGGQTKQDRLTVQRLSELNLRNAKIAYLSECSTIENNVPGLSDEVIHVASGFQVASFPHVICCLWPSVDSVSAQVASNFHSWVLGRRAVKWDDRLVAMTLHQAVTEARRTKMSMPLEWARFVHYGA